jgi:hypothetical protein
MRNFLAACALAAAVGATGANASIMVNAVIGGAPAGVAYVNFDNLALGNAGGTSGGIQVSFTGDGKIVQGAASGLYAAPYLSNFNGTAFGDPTNGPDSTYYVTTGVGGAKLSFPGQEHYVGLLWGSVDTYNWLEFYNGATLVGTVTGTDVNLSANGDQGMNGTFYVNMISTLAFDSIVARSSSYAFEFDNVAYDTSQNVLTPEPLSLALFGTGLALFAARRRRRN